MLSEIRWRKLKLTGVARLFLIATLWVSVSAATAHAVRLVNIGLGMQTTRKTGRTENRRGSTPQPSPSNKQQGVETLKTVTDLVTVPIIATEINGLYIPDLNKNEFTITEDGVPQEIAFFATVNTSFHVVLMLDTSASTQQKLSLIQQAAVTFVEQLQKGDQVKVISFDDQVRDLNVFTNDRGLLKTAINQTRSGTGMKLYDAFALALSVVSQIQGRKAIVVFSDGVDFRSDSASFDGTLRGLDEEGVIVYPIRYSTREETERIAREQSGPQLPTIGVIRTPPPTGTNAPTFPSDDPGSVPTSTTRSKTGPLGLPLPDEILRRRRDGGRDPQPGDLPGPDPVPPVNDPNARRPDRKNDPNPQTGRPSKREDDPIPKTGRIPRRDDDVVKVTLDELYITADRYLQALADKSGGRLLRADTVGALPDAFTRIAAELRTQYSIGYYPSNKARNEGYRNIKVSSTRKNVIIRARPGYHSPARG